MHRSGFLPTLFRLCLFLGLLIVPTGAGGQVPAPPAPAAEAPPDAPAPGALEREVAIALAHRAERLKKAFLSKDDAAVQGALQEVDQLRYRFGTVDVLPLVEGMALWARQLGASDQVELGLTVVQNLERWAPRHPTLLSTRISLMRKQGLQGYLWSLSDVLLLNKIRWNHAVHRYLWMVQHFAWLRFMATFLLWGWTLTMALRYRRVFRNLWEEPLGARGLSPGLMALLGALLLAMPVLLGLDPALAAFLWLWMLVPFLGKPEFVLSAALVLFQLVHPALAVLEPMAGQEVRPSVVSLQIQPQPQSLDAQGVRYLPAKDRAFLEAWQKLQFQDWAGAEAAFSELRGSHPDVAEVLNNIGVARFQRGDLEGASKAFEEAFRVAPGRVEILVNQSVIAFGNLDPVQGVGKQEEARQADPAAFDRLMQVERAGRSPRTFGMPLPDTPERSAALATVLDAPEEGHLLKLPPVAGIVLSALLPLLAAALLFWRLNRSVRQAHPTQCIRCGEPFHTTDSPDPSVCSKCHHLFILKDGLHGESRLRKLDEVAEFQDTQRWIHRALIAILPGMDSTFMGKTREGFQEFALLALALGLVVATGRSVRYPGEILADPTSTWLPIGLMLLIVLYLRSWLKLKPKPSRS